MEYQAVRTTVTVVACRPGSEGAVPINASYTLTRRDSHPDSQYSYRTPGERSTNYDLYDAELDVNKEKRTQKYLISMVTIYAICLCPLMVLRIIQPAHLKLQKADGNYCSINFPSTPDRCHLCGRQYPPGEAP